MKVLIFGAGVIGSYYATKLHAAKIDVSILARGEKFNSIQEKGVIVEDYFTHRQTVSKIRVIDKPDDKAYDVIMVMVQMVHINDVLPVLAEFTNAKSLLFIGNNVNGFDEIVNQVRNKDIFAGFGAVGGKRAGHKVLFADANPKKPNKKAPIVLGKINATGEQNFAAVIEIFESADIRVEVVDDMDGWLKTHAAMILGLAGAAYKTEYDMKRIAVDKELVNLIVTALRESMNVLKSLGITIIPKRNRYLDFFPDFFLQSVFKNLLDSEYAEIAIAGHAAAARGEMRALADGFLTLCQKSKVDFRSFEKLTGYI